MSKVKIFAPALPQIPWQEKPASATGVMWRYTQNPIIPRNPFPGVARVFNSAIVPYENGYKGLFRVEGNSCMPYVHAGYSNDGLHFTIDKTPLVLVNEDGSPAEIGDGQYDPRLVKVEDSYYGIWCEQMLGAWKYPTLGMCRTTDFKTYYRVPSPLLPPQRNGVLFPRKVNGEYLLLSRPSDLGNTPFGDIFLSHSKDMKYWGNHTCLLKSEDVGNWGRIKIGAGPAPIETSEGWLLFYHGVISTCAGLVYSLSACLLDINDPSKVLYNCCEYLLTPEEIYETSGFVDNVVFPCATLVDGDTGRIALYYGAADTCTCLAFTQIDELVEHIKTHGPSQRKR